MIFGLFLLGEWNATIYGSWQVEGPDLALVSFEGYSVQLVGAFGWRPLQREFLKVKSIYVPGFLCCHRLKLTYTYEEQGRQASG